MKRPSTTTLIIGHPIVSTPLFLLGAFFGFEAVTGNASPWFGIATLFAFGGLSRCSTERSRFLAWEREWNAMNPDYQPPRPFRYAARFLGMLAVAAGVIVAWAELPPMFADPNSPALTIAEFGVVGLVLLWIVRRVFRRRPKQRAPRDFIVTQAISRPVAAPSAREAYAGLPDYCRQLLKP